MVRVPTHRAPTHPGEMLSLESLKPRGSTQVERTQRIGVGYPRVNELVHGRRAMTPDMALRVERLFGVEAQVWMNLQLAWDLYLTAHVEDAKELRRSQRPPRLDAPNHAA